MNLSLASFFVIFFNFIGISLGEFSAFGDCTEVDFKNPKAIVYILDPQTKEVQCTPTTVEQLSGLKKENSPKGSYLKKIFRYLPSIPFIQKRSDLKVCDINSTALAHEKKFYQLAKNALEQYQWIDRKTAWENYINELKSQAATEKEDEGSSLQAIQGQITEITGALRRRRPAIQSQKGESSNGKKVTSNSAADPQERDSHVPKEENRVQLNDLIPEDSYKMHFYHLAKGASALLLTFVVSAVIDRENPVHLYTLAGVSLAVLVGQKMAQSAWGSALDRKSLSKISLKYKDYFRFAGSRIGTINQAVNYAPYLGYQPLEIIPSYLLDGIGYLPFIGKIFKLYDAAEDLHSAFSGYTKGYTSLEAIEKVNWAAFRKGIISRQGTVKESLTLSRTVKQGYQSVSVISCLCQAYAWLKDVEKKGNQRFESTIDYFHRKTHLSEKVSIFSSKFPFFNRPGAFKNQLDKSGKEQYYLELNQYIDEYSKNLQNVLKEAGELFSNFYNQAPIFKDIPKNPVDSKSEVTDQKIEAAERVAHQIMKETKDIQQLIYEVSTGALKQIEENEAGHNFSINLNQPGIVSESNSY